MLIGHDRRHRPRRYRQRISLRRRRFASRPPSGIDDRVTTDLGTSRVAPGKITRSSPAPAFRGHRSLGEVATERITVDSSLGAPRSGSRVRVRVEAFRIQHVTRTTSPAVAVSPETTVTRVGVSALPATALLRHPKVVVAVPLPTLLTTPLQVGVATLAAVPTRLLIIGNVSSCTHGVARYVISSASRHPPRPIVAVPFCPAVNKLP